MILVIFNLQFNYLECLLSVRCPVVVDLELFSIEKRDCEKVYLEKEKKLASRTF